jgi:regulator of cell morphogenesis and NO signaling
MSAATLGSTVGQLVIERPARSRLFERLGIDYCRGGKKPLAQACRDRGLNARQVLRQLIIADAETPAADAVDAAAKAAANASADRDAVERDWSKVSLTQLADHIEATHHAYLKSELPRLQLLLEKVARVHGEDNPRLLTLHQVFGVFKSELERHLFDEEEVLFPMCRQLETARGLRTFDCGTIGNSVRVMIRHHDDAGAALETMRSLTDDYTVPQDACGTYRAMLDALLALEQDMHQHVHKENNILFPRAVAAEEAGGQRPG